MSGLILALLLAQDYDILIRNGSVVDGTGNPAYAGDLAIKDGRIAALGRVPAAATARRVIDARGLVVAPGFIDMHNHSDDTLLADGNAESMIRQGVTSMVLGEGNSAAPSAAFPDFNAYWSKLLERGISTNVASYVGSSQIWTRVHGERAGPASAADTARMAEFVREAMRQGALGVASLLSNPPGNWIDTPAMTAMAKAAGEFGGLYSTHLRTEGHGVFEAAEEALAIGRAAGVPVDIIHIKIAEHRLWGKMPEFIAQLEKARSAGQQVTANIYPYRAGQNNLSSIIPPWAHEGGAEAMLARLKDPALKGRLEREILQGIPGSNWYNHYTATGSWEGMLLVSLKNPAYQKFQGKRMSEVIAALGGKPVDVLFQLLAENRASVPTIFFHHSEDDMRFALRQPWISIGSDGTAVKSTGPLAANHVHPRYYGTFARLLGRYVRDEKVLTLEEAIRKMTSANAIKTQQWDRGILRPGFAADVTVFNPRTIEDKSTWEQPHQYAVGVDHVIVNGVLVLDRGQHTGARPGKILKGPGARP